MGSDSVARIAKRRGAGFYNLGPLSQDKEKRLGGPFTCLCKYLYSTFVSHTFPSPWFVFLLFPRDHTSTQERRSLRAGADKCNASPQTFAYLCKAVQSQLLTGLESKKRKSVRRRKKNREAQGNDAHTAGGHRTSRYKRLGR